MVTEASRVFFSLAAVSFVVAVLYGASTGDHAGLTLLLSLVVVASTAGVIVARARDRQVAPATAADAEAPASLPVTAGPALGGGVWPLAGAVAVGLVLLGFLAGPLATLFGIGLGLATIVGWLAVTAGEHWGREVTLLPLGLPVVGLTAIASLMFLMSRILLAVSEQASTWIALGVAVVILAVASFFAIRPSVSPRMLTAALAAGSVLMIAGGLAAGAIGPRHIESHAPHAPPGAEVAADNLVFTITEMHLPANTPLQIHFENKETVPHNVAIYADRDASQSIFVGDVVVGPIETVYEVPPTPAGSYFFRCDIHPNMAGTVAIA